MVTFRDNCTLSARTCQGGGDGMGAPSQKRSPNRAARDLALRFLNGRTASSLAADRRAQDVKVRREAYPRLVLGDVLSGS